MSPIATVLTKEIFLTNLTKKLCYYKDLSLTTGTRTYMKDNALNDPTLVRHVPDNGGHVVVFLFYQCRPEHNG